MNPAIAILKKYKNRRIYDGRSSRYVNMEEVRAMFLAEENIRIVDGSSSKDLTSQMLLQLLQQEERADCALPLALLKNALIAGEKGEGALFKERVKQALTEAQLLSEGESTDNTSTVQSPSAQEREVVRLRQEIREKINTRIPSVQNPELDPLSGSVSKSD